MWYVLLAIGLVVATGINVVLVMGSRKGAAKGTTEVWREMLAGLEAGVSRMDRGMREEFGRNREEIGRSMKENREEIGRSFQLLNEVLNNRLHRLQEENGKKLDEMRKVVDEKLQESVERRFNESFKFISERLDLVHKGLGEMQSLASGVGDLKKVLTNVKTRGNLGEIRLGSILEQILSPEQYEQNVAVRPESGERVEYVIRLPGRDGGGGGVLLPIDSKFPNEDYQRLMDAYDNAANLSPRELEGAAKLFEAGVRRSAREIGEKYICPPATTDFAILFVPTEGLYAEILRRPGLFESLRGEWKITVVGPANLAAFLSSLQMGFRTLAIERRSSEVWEVLGAVKAEFGTFGAALEKTKKKLLEATNVIDMAGVRSRAIERKLRTVQELPAGEGVDPAPMAVGEGEEGEDLFATEEIID